LGAQSLVERELGKLWTVLDQADPGAAREAFVTRRVLDDSIERDVVAYDDLPHFAVLRLRYSLTTRRCSSYAHRSRLRGWGCAPHVQASICAGSRAVTLTGDAARSQHSGFALRLKFRHHRRLASREDLKS